MKKFDYEKYEKEKAYFQKKVDTISSIRMLIFIFMIGSFILGAKNNYFNYLGILFIIIFVILIFIHDNYYKKLDYYRKYIAIINEYIDRINGKWRNFNDIGEEFSNDLFNDLDIVGSNSLFQYLNISRTLGGRRKFIDLLSNKKSSDVKLRERQEAILELSKKINFVIDFQVQLQCYKKNEKDLEKNLELLNKNVGSKKIELGIAVVCSFISVVLLILGWLNVISYNYFYGFFIFNFLINYMYSYIYRDVFSNITDIASDYSNLLGVYNSIINNNFDSKLLVKFRQDVLKSKNNIKKLIYIDDLNNLKNNILSNFIFNGFFCINLIVMYMYSKFQESDIKNVKKGIIIIENMEALISLAGLGMVKDNVVIPKISNNVSIHAVNICHPLLLEKNVVGNDFNSTNGVNVITGSNMGGKTSFLRTIGINLILFSAGSFVCASEFSSSYFKIYTSMRVSDDIDKGISTFYGELLRIKKALSDKSDNRLVLVDEIFKGTNYNDRMYGAYQVMKKLNDNRTILLITTHDFELCDAKIDNLNNYYFKEYYEGEVIKFDYKIRSGKCDSTNAKYLMKKLGIIDD